jgi:hypothetical protein
MAWSLTWTTVRTSRGPTAFSLNNADGGVPTLNDADLHQARKAINMAWQILDSDTVGNKAVAKTVALTGTAGQAMSITISGGGAE